MLVHGRWGGICGDYYNWDNNDAKVVCRQLGLPDDGAQALYYSNYDYYFNVNEEPLVFGDVYCTGNEAYISDCPNSGMFVQNCGYSYYYYTYDYYADAGVRCRGISLQNIV